MYIVAVPKHIVQSDCKVFHEAIEVRLEYNIIFQNGNIIQYFLNNENIYEMRLCHKGDKFKSNIYKKLNISVDNLIEEGYSKKIEDNKAISIARNLLDILDDETISEKTDLSLQEVKNLVNLYKFMKFP
ncbi:MAG: hypothetical protein ACRCTZ_02425 [Sarcina sp.]